MINTTHYNLQKAEANDIVNGLLPANTNLDKIDTAMFNNLNSGLHNASHTKTGTVHALVRTVTTANFFKFSATDDFRTGDTFTLDGEVITARTQAYAGLPDYAFRTGSEVIAITDHGVLTIYCAGDNITVDDALSQTSENPVQNKVIDGALSTIEDDVTAVANKVGSAPLQTNSKNCSGAINELNAHFTELGALTKLGTTTSGSVVYDDNKILLLKVLDQSGNTFTKIIFVDVLPIENTVYVNAGGNDKGDILIRFNNTDGNKFVTLHRCTTGSTAGGTLTVYSVKL